MSAQPIPEPARHPTNLKAACFAPLSFFDRCLDLEYTRLRCLGLIIAETLGAHPSRTFAPIDQERFVDATHVSKEHISNALSFLESAKIIRVSTSPGGVPMYALRDEYIQEVKGAGRTKVQGRCPDCKTIGLFSTEFVPTAFLALRKLGSCVGPAVYKAYMVVNRYTSKWPTGARSLESIEQELNLNDFTRLTDLESREIINGLNEAVQLGIIGRLQRKGKASLFWVIPEGIDALGKRPFRVVTPSYSGVKEDAKESASKNEEKPAKQADTSADESKSYIYGRCGNCGHFVDVEPVSEGEFADAQPKTPEVSPNRPARAGPGRETGVKESKWDKTKRAIWEMYVAK